MVLFAEARREPCRQVDGRNANDVFVLRSVACTAAPPGAAPTPTVEVAVERHAIDLPERGGAESIADMQKAVCVSRAHCTAHSSTPYCAPPTCSALAVIL